MVMPPPHDPHYVPRRGHVVWINFTPQAGGEIWNWRPALVLSPEKFNKQKKLAVVCPITRTRRSTNPFEIEVPEDIDVDGVICADQVKSVDWQERSARFLCSMPVEVVKQAADIVYAIMWG